MRDTVKMRDSEREIRVERGLETIESPSSDCDCRHRLNRPVIVADQTALRLSPTGLPRTPYTAYPTSLNDHPILRVNLPELTWDPCDATPELANPLLLPPTDHIAWPASRVTLDLAASVPRRTPHTDLDLAWPTLIPLNRTLHDKQAPHVTDTNSYPADRVTLASLCPNLRPGL
ncbi:hypothetical protein RJT34_13193 [Clitoria ternatea]|uniref:Uncharacterized protein n=1 Tax=Clitoria ternatea TaxID=43366 RepID=A0AAN9JNH6_CLITE